MGNVWKFCTDFADYDSHHGSLDGASDGFVVAGSVGVSPSSGSRSSRSNNYEPNSDGRKSILTLSTNESQSTDSDWKQCIDAISPSSSISDGWICATESDAADSVAAEASHSCYAGLARRVL